jgi:NitT/TauT family transport system substrate-binding protein
MKKRVAIAAGIVIILGIFTILLFKEPAEPEKIEKLRVGLLPDAVSALLFLGKQQGLFKRHGLDVSFENYQAGAFAVNDLLAGKIDVATATEFVLAIRAFKRADLRAVGTISSSDTIEVVARRDRGIEKPDHLKGKLVGDSKGTATSFYLSSFLSLNNIPPGEIRTVDIKPSEMITALSEGRVDAAVSFSPHLDAIKRALAGKALSWPAQGGRDFYYLMITREDLIKTRPGAMIGLLKGVLEAETYLRKHEKEAQEIVKSQLGVDQETLMSTWSKTRFRVRLDQDLLTLMDDEGRWAIRNKLVEAGRIPDYSTYLYPEGLKKLKPEAVGTTY